MDFSVVNIPDAPPQADEDSHNSTGTSDLVCQVCGVGLSYSGRGRKPLYCDDHKTSTRSASGPSKPRSGRDVDSAMAALDGAHDALTFALMLASPDAASAFSDNRESLDLRNRKILESDPALAKRLGAAAAKGGGFALVLSHAIAIGPAVLIAGSNVSANRAAKRAAREEAEAMDFQGPMGTVSPLDPDAVFKAR